MFARKVVSIYVLLTLFALTALVLNQTAFRSSKSSNNASAEPAKLAEPEEPDTLHFDDGHYSNDQLADAPYMLKPHTISVGSEDFIGRAMTVMLKTATNSKMEDFTFMQSISKYVCDKTGSGRCDIRLNEDFVYHTLGKKTKALLDHLCSNPTELPEVLVKIDDDLILDKNEYNQILGDFIRAPCIYGGPMSSNGKKFYWAGGALYMLKREALQIICSKDRTMTPPYYSHEDVFIGKLLDISDPSHACSISDYAWHHRDYSDGRITVKYKVIH